MSYGQFASIYDQFMYDQRYDRWLEVIRPYLKENMLDLATGTGALLDLIPHNVKVTGVDLSEEMLAIAASKRSDVTLIAQDMTKLELNQKFQLITCLCDSLNYLAEPEDVQKTFQSVLDHLEDDGIFIFDVHSTAKFEAYFDNQTYSDELDKMLYIWHAVQGEVPFSVYHDLTFFIKDNKDDIYHRFDEQHFQRTFDIDTYKLMLEQIGFEIITIFADFDPDFVVDTNEEAYFDRVFFIVRKKEIMK